MNDQERAFHRAMVDVYQTAKKEAGYNATRFLQMLSELGGLETARHLLNSDTVSDGFTALWQKKKLDITVEAVVLKPEFSELFTDEERRIAEDRLNQYGYRP